MQGAMQGRAAQVLRPQCAASAASRRAGARCLGLSDLRPAPALAHPAALHRLSPLSRRHTAASRQRRGEFRRLIYLWGVCAAMRDAAASCLPCRRSRPRRMCPPLRSPSVRGGRAAPVERRRRSPGPGGRARSLLRACTTPTFQAPPKASRWTGACGLPDVALCAGPGVSRRSERAFFWVWRTVH